MDSGATEQRIQLTACVVDLDARAVLRSEGQQALSTTEAELLAYLVARPGQDAGRGEFLREVWGYAEGVVTRTVDTAMTRLRAKVEQDPRRSDHLVTVWGTGYRFVPSTSRAPAPSAVLPAVPAPRPTNLESRASGYLASPTLFEAVHQALSAARVVTLLGPAGVGKTRLAQEVARGSLSQWPGGAWFCDLSECHELEEVCAALAEVLDIPLAEPRPVEQLGRALSSRGAVLVVLDHFEQLAALAHDTVGRWSQLAPEARLLVTSRELLRVEGEVPVAVPTLEAERGVRLFVDRAASARPGFTLSEAEQAEAEALVDELDGLPLAIELAAARAAVLDVGGIRARLGRRFDLLQPRPQRHGPSSLLRAR